MLAGKTVSVIIPAYNEEKYIARCLESVIAQDYPAELMEVLVADGRSEDRTREIILDYGRRYPYIKLVDNPGRKQVIALNIMIGMSTGEFIVRMDAHSLYEPDYVSQCIELLLNTDASNVGGVQKAIGTTYVQKAIALAMSSPFGVGNAYFRYKDEQMYVDSVFLGAWRRETLIELGGYNDEYDINEDYEINYRLRKMGGKILLSPKIKCSYFVRGSLKKLAIQYFKYGMWKVKTLGEHPQSLVYRQLIPVLFVLSLLASLILLFIRWPAGLVIPAVYLAVSLLFSARISIAQGLKYFFILPVIFAMLHLSYGIGFLFGLRRFGFPPLRLKEIFGSFREN